MDSLNMAKYLKHCFPKIMFFREGFINPEKTDIYMLIEKSDISDFEEPAGVELKLIWAMRKDKKKFAYLFPDDTEKSWEELGQNIKAGKPDVILFFISKIDENFAGGFNKAVREELRLNDVSPVVGIFEKEHLDKIFRVEEFEDAKSLNICVHNPPSFYGAYQYYAHKQYTLLRRGREFNFENNIPVEADKYDTEIKIGQNSINEEFLEDIPSGANEKQILRFVEFTEKIQKILESTPDGYDQYTPTDFDKLSKQIKGQKEYTGKWKIFNPDNVDNDQEIFSHLDRENIDNRCDAVLKYLAGEGEEEFKAIRQAGTYFEKITALFEKVSNPAIRNRLQDRTIEDIEGLYGKLRRSQFSIDAETESNTSEGSNREKIHIKAKYADVEVGVLSKDLRETFVNEYLKKEFNAVEDEKFLGYVREESQHILLQELLSYITQWTHNTKSELFKNYLKGRDPAKAMHTYFARKIVKSIDAFNAWYKQEFYQKEVK